MGGSRCRGGLRAGDLAGHGDRGVGYFWALPSARTDARKQFGEYLVAVGLSYVINLAAFKVCTIWLGLGVMWAAFWAIPPSTVVVFLILNYRVCRGAHRAE